MLDSFEPSIQCAALNPRTSAPVKKKRYISSSSERSGFLVQPLQQICVISMTEIGLDESSMEQLELPSPFSESGALRKI